MFLLVLSSPQLNSESTTLIVVPPAELGKHDADCVVPPAVLLVLSPQLNSESTTLIVLSPQLNSESTTLIAGVVPPAELIFLVLSPQLNSESTTLIVGATSSEWTALIDASGLEAGVYYKVCCDLDGNSTTLYFGDTGYDLFISPFMSLQAQGVLGSPSTIMTSIEPYAGTSANNIILAKCFDGDVTCSPLVRVHADNECDVADADGKNTALNPFNGADVGLSRNIADQSFWNVPVEATLLMVGMHTKVRIPTELGGEPPQKQVPDVQQCIRKFCGPHPVTIFLLRMINHKNYQTHTSLTSIYRVYVLCCAPERRQLSSP